MDWRNPRDKKMLREELVERLVSKNHVLPGKSISIQEIRALVIDEEKDKMENIAENLVQEESPVKRDPNDEKRIGITSLEEGREYLSDLNSTSWEEF